MEVWGAVQRRLGRAGGRLGRRRKRGKPCHFCACCGSGLSFNSDLGSRSCVRGASPPEVRPRRSPDLESPASRSGPREPIAQEQAGIWVKKRVGDVRASAK